MFEVHNAFAHSMCSKAIFPRECTNVNALCSGFDNVIVNSRIIHTCVDDQPYETKQWNEWKTLTVFAFNTYLFTIIVNAHKYYWPFMNH